METSIAHICLCVRSRRRRLVRPLIDWDLLLLLDHRPTTLEIRQEKQHVPQLPLPSPSADHRLHRDRRLFRPSKCERVFALGAAMTRPSDKLDDTHPAQCQHKVYAATLEDGRSRAAI